jgi:hypothetical protein
MRILKFEELLNENKMFWKTIPEILSWLDLKSQMNFIWIDVETTGLIGTKQEQIHKEVTSEMVK